MQVEARGLDFRGVPATAATTATTAAAETASSVTEDSSSVVRAAAATEATTEQCLSQMGKPVAWSSNLSPSNSSRDANPGLGVGTA